MADHSNIEWTDATFNPWIGCTKISPACDHCYAEAMMDHRLGRVRWGAGEQRQRTSAANWRQPLRWNRQDFRACGDCGWRGAIDTLESDTCPSCGKHERLDPARRRVFCASLADVFDNEVDPQWRADLFELIQATPNLDWLLLTKRIGNVPAMVSIIPGWMPANVWLGATICNQIEADRDIPKLLATPARVRFLSMEPLLGPVGLWPEWLHTKPSTHRVGIDWVIVGGESGAHARPTSPEWARSLRDQCAAAGVPFLFKQWGEWLPMLGQAEGVPVNEKATTADGWVMGWAGKKAAGRLLDGVQHDGYPG